MRTRSSSIAQPPQPPSRPTSSAMGMSPETRYQYNLKVLRRRDPSIISILDQFSHVCVYHHNGERWEKNGYEGSMFLYERNSYPPYGFYILNRMGMDDHIQRLYPWDRITAQNSITMLRSFPSYSKNRSERIHEMFLPDERPDKFAEVYKWDKEKEQV
ncbi:PH domain-like protein, partial [Dendrothele bispora CBS 962.96]